ncbi:hypothetical protein KL86PLE_90699 [uncultured Pleomorphomonas sp.]|uniref:Uncharacterized protein n=1 Tax=uncultured Pleomorphomonas sp. TaxID=442121 RepID=A0A212LQT5_9HYPH|nr:hypothetical protein [uncultured Pleomorphomonas sp.]SCM79903.1 hypothetical protein KL86PLE_90699 [uncultured Pleomorphomonas sp.]
MTLDEKRHLIKKAFDYRSGVDSCGSVYMGSMAKAELFRRLGGSFVRDSLDALLTKADDAHLSSALAYCSEILAYAEKHPVQICPCCGQIIPGKPS